MSEPISGQFQDQMAERVRPYIDLIDYLRSIGIEKELPLPSIAVVGDQSSGKSSVLEALSGVALPRGNGIVTRCPLELRLCYVSGVAWKAVISYRDKRINIGDPSEVAGHVKEAQNELAGEGVGICDELISLKIMSSSVCDLTLIDLPGIARVPVQGQPEDIGAQIKRLILKILSKQKTINLVVVPCNVDIATTEALKMAKEVDPEGTRTLAILTKPDLIDRGTEKDVLDIVRNKIIPLNMGYVIVKCRGQKQINDGVTINDAIEEERDFFENHDEFSSLLDEERVTTKCLAARLTQTLVNHIQKSMPQMADQIKQQLWVYQTELTKYEGGPPVDPVGKRKYLIEVIKQFNYKIDQLCRGELKNDENLFINMQNIFAKWFEKLGHSRAGYHKMTQDVVNEFDQKHRGRELPGFNNYTLFESVVQKLVGELKNPAMDTLQKIKDLVQKHFFVVSKNSFENYPCLQRFSMTNIDDIQKQQLTTVMDRIEEQFEMEMQMYTQDEIFARTLTPAQKETPGKTDCSGYDTRSKYPELLNSYFEIVVQRLADQVPMLIRYFILKESARILSSEMLGLLNREDLDEMLKEESEIGRKREALRDKVKRLGLANNKISSLWDQSG
ncbi:interferon-induced GTP-binding protein Mx2-like [Oncorhynchus mykiss]|uniref:Uncharacterized protein n=1 Tax=Oncorhynchus mykiss TaxID=8022 RepID=A0A8C7SQ78_ONCMY|nr:interferon-induced GTP-binding protein Mx2-like [Oncorhynchus mykiss]